MGRRVTKQDYLEIQASSLPIKELMFRYGVSFSTIYTIRKKTYPLMERRGMKAFADIKTIKNVVAEEYFKCFKHEAEVRFSKTGLIYQFYILPNKIIIQMSESFVDDEKLFRKYIKRNLTNWIAFNKKKSKTSIL